MGTILVLRALGLGDALTAVPALRGLRRGYPRHRLLLAAAGPPAHLLLQHGVVDGVVPTAGLDAAPPGRDLGEHLAINLHGRGPQSHRLLQAGRPRELIAFGNAQAGVAGPDWVESEHEVLRWCRLVAGCGGRPDPHQLRLELGLPDERTRARPIVLHPGASTPDRRWPLGRWAQLAHRLAAQGRRVLLTGTAAESQLCASIAADAGLRGEANRCGRLGLRDLAGLLARSLLLVCGDTGVAHLGTAVGTPSVVLFGPFPPSRWGPLIDRERHRVLWHGPTGLARITVEEVVAAATALLGDPTDGSPR